MNKLILFLSCLFAVSAYGLDNLFIETQDTTDDETVAPIDIAIQDQFVSVGILRSGKIIKDSETGIEIIEGMDSLPIPDGAEIFSAFNITQLPAALQPQLRAKLLKFYDDLLASHRADDGLVTRDDLMEVYSFLFTFKIEVPDPIVVQIEDELTQDQDRPVSPDQVPAPPAPPVVTPPVDDNDQYFAPGS